MIVGHQWIERRDEKVSPHPEFVLVLKQSLRAYVFLNDISALSEPLATKLASLIDTVQVVVLEETQLSLFLGEDVLPDEVNLRLEQISERRIVYQIEVVLALVFVVQSVGVGVEVHVYLYAAIALLEVSGQIQLLEGSCKQVWSR